MSDRDTNFSYYGSCVWTAHVRRNVSAWWVSNIFANLTVPFFAAGYSFFVHHSSWGPRCCSRWIVTRKTDDFSPKETFVVSMLKGVIIFPARKPALFLRGIHKICQMGWSKVAYTKRWKRYDVLKLELDIKWDGRSYEMWLQANERKNWNYRSLAVLETCHQLSRISASLYSLSLGSKVQLFRLVHKLIENPKWNDSKKMLLTTIDQKLTVKGFGVPLLELFRRAILISGL